MTGKRLLQGPALCVDQEPRITQGLTSSHLATLPAAIWPVLAPQSHQQPCRPSVAVSSLMLQIWSAKYLSTLLPKQRHMRHKIFYAAHSPLKCMSSYSLALRMHFTCFQALDPKHPPHSPLLCMTVLGCIEHVSTRMGPPPAREQLQGLWKKRAQGSPALCCSIPPGSTQTHVQQAPLASRIPAQGPSADNTPSPLLVRCWETPPTFTQPNPRATWLLPALSHKPHSLHPDVPWCCTVQEEPPVAPAHSQPTLMSSQPGWCPQDVTSILTLNLKCHLFTPTPCCTFVRAQPSRATPPAQPNLSWATERWPKAKATLPGQHLPEEHAPGTDLSRCSPCQDP